MNYLFLQLNKTKHWHFSRCVRKLHKVFRSTAEPALTFPLNSGCDICSVFLVPPAPNCVCLRWRALLVQDLFQDVVWLLALWCLVWEDKAVSVSLWCSANFTSAFCSRPWFSRSAPGWHTENVERERWVLNCQFEIRMSKEKHIPDLFSEDLRCMLQPTSTISTCGVWPGGKEPGDPNCTFRILKASGLNWTLLQIDC